MEAEAAIREVVDRETRAWDTGDVGLLPSVVHPDVVWPWRTADGRRMRMHTGLLDYPV